MTTGSDSLEKIGIGTLMVGAAWISGAIKGRNDARRQALSEVVGWARSQGETTKHYPHLIDAYRQYSERLEAIKPGTRAVPLKKFAEQLSANGL